ncbi:ATP-binding protein [Streptomyces sp. NPDC020766]|uniref:ATP-binding protein n=1 Tax=Streptomyces sp. NPDC020766 TaxID=3155011 RepID=UPI0033C53AE0
MMTATESRPSVGRILRAIATLLEPSPEAVSRARRTVHDALAAWGLDNNLTDDMVLVASELVTNALQHASGPIVMVLQQRDETVLVEVADVSPALPVPCRESADDESGRGLALVEAFSDDWGYRRRGNSRGKWVWCSWSLSPTATRLTDELERRLRLLGLVTQMWLAASLYKT